MNKFTVRVITEIENPPFKDPKRYKNEIYWTFTDLKSALDYMDHILNKYPLVICKNPMYERRSYLRKIELYQLIDEYESNDGIYPDPQEEQPEKDIERGIIC